MWEQGLIKVVVGLVREITFIICFIQRENTTFGLHFHVLKIFVSFIVIQFSDVVLKNYME